MELVQRIKGEKAKRQDWQRGKSVNNIARQLIRYDKLKMLGVDEAEIRKAVGVAKPPLDFEEKWIGDLPHEPTLVRLLKYKALPTKWFNDVPRTHQVYSSLFLTIFNEEKHSLSLYRFTTRNKHEARELRRSLAKNIFSLREILAARTTLPFREAWRHIDFELDFYHYDSSPAWSLS
jgi:hypothetical protein